MIEGPTHPNLPVNDLHLQPGKRQSHGSILETIHAVDRDNWRGLTHPVPLDEIKPKFAQAFGHLRVYGSPA